jgi:hypothetical protein
MAMGVLMMLAGAYGGCTMVVRASAEDTVSPGSLRRYTAPRPEDAEDSQPPLPPEVLLLIGVLGAGFCVYGVRHIRLEGRLLRDGVPVVGHITDVRHVPEVEYVVSYRFRDDHGVVHEGTFEPDALLHEDYEAGQEVTILYDPQDSTVHMLDVDNIRRVDAKLRHL